MKTDKAVFVGYQPSPVLFRKDTEREVSYSSRYCFYLPCLIVMVAAALRFWGLGDVGLHGDEDTTSLPALSILKSGLPINPSGMLYPRAMGQLYLMAASISVFGLSEWALRLPSAVTGVLGVLMAFFLGKRFLPPKWNLAFMLIMALHPAMLIWAKTARMYIFLSTFTMLYAIFILRWEERDSWGNYISAFITFILALESQHLAIFSSFMFFYPYLMKRTGKRLLQGVMAFSTAAFLFLLHRKWLTLQYGATLADSFGEAGQDLTPLHLLFVNHPWAMGALLCLGVITLGIAVYSLDRKTPALYCSIVLLAAGMAACFLLEYGLGYLLIGSGTIIYLRFNGNKGVLIMVGFLCLLFLVQFFLLYQTKLFAGHKAILQAMAGHFSPNTTADIFQEQGWASLLYLLALAYAALSLIRGLSVPHHFLFFLLSVAIPLTGMGYFKWHVDSRFILHLLPFFILSWLAGIIYLKEAHAWTFSLGPIRKPNSPLPRFGGEGQGEGACRAVFLAPHPSPLPRGERGFSDRHLSAFTYKAVLALFILAFINPFATYRSVKIRYGDVHHDQEFLDNVGAASFIRHAEPDASDLIIVEDYLMYTYYLGEVDYWLRPFEKAKIFTKVENETMVNIYTGTPLIGSAQELEKLLKDRGRSSVYVVAQTHKLDGTEIADVMNRHHPEVVFEGRDRKTRVWYYPAPNRSVPPS